MKRTNPVYLLFFTISLIIIIVSIIYKGSFDLSERYKETLESYAIIATITLELLFLIILLRNVRLLLRNKIVLSSNNRYAIFDIGISTGLSLLLSVTYFVAQESKLVVYFILVGGLFFLKMRYPLKQSLNRIEIIVRIVLNVLLIAAIVITFLTRESINKERDLYYPDTTFLNEQLCWEFEVPEGYNLGYKGNVNSFENERMDLYRILQEDSILFTLSEKDVFAVGYTSEVNDISIGLNDYYESVKDYYINSYSDLDLRVYKEIKVLIDSQLFNGVDLVPMDELPFRVLLLTSVYNARGINIIVIYLDDQKTINLLESLINSSFGCEEGS